MPSLNPEGLPFLSTGTIIGAVLAGLAYSTSVVLRGGDVQEKDATSSFVLAAVVGVLALLGLFLAAGAKDGVFYATGLGLFVFCVLFIFGMIHRQVGR
jgi:hypothetical protein